MPSLDTAANYAEIIGAAAVLFAIRTFERHEWLVYQLADMPVPQDSAARHAGTR